MTPGIKDVARIAGVSPATVSRVLAGRHVDPAMSERVLAAVRETGYRPNLAARRLRSRHSNTIGLIVADIRNPFFTAVSRAVEQIACEHDLRLILCNTDEDPAKEAMYLGLMQEERATGVILAPTTHFTETAHERAEDFPVVLIDRMPIDDGAGLGSGPTRDGVVLDNRAMAGELVAHLHREGHRRIAGLFGATSNTGPERRRGYEQAMVALGLAPQAHDVPHGTGQAEAVVTALMAGGERPEAIVTSNGVMTIAVLRALHQLGLDVPGDVALAGFDSEPWMDLVGGGLTVIEQPVEEIGRLAMAMLFERLERRDSPARKVVLRGRCIARGSSRAMHAA